MTISECGSDYSTGTRVGDPRLVCVDVFPTAAPALPRHVFAFAYKPAAGSDMHCLLVPDGYPKPTDSVVRSLSALCDHCGQEVRWQRFYRLRNLDTGGFANVSEGCLAHHVGDPVAAALLTSWLARYESFLVTIRGSIPRVGREHFGVLEVIKLTLDVIELRGWVSRGDAHRSGSTATAALVLDLLEYDENELVGDSSMGFVQLADEVRALADKNLERAATIYRWLLATRRHEATPSTTGSVVPLTDYLHNLATVASLEYVEARHVGLLCSAPGAYADFVAEQAYRAAQPAPAPVGKHYGTLDERAEADVYVDSIENRGENEWGVSLLVHMHVVPTGERLKWWTGEGLKFDEGKQYHVRMTVKKHDHWEGRNETIVSRVMEYDPPPPKEKKPRGKKS